ncbi:MAG TPA: 4Fe-4S dicluster domain-containing protein [Ignavibacteriales bacterium]|nr:4Fe-4S dicluster domain-containing protein [Ignavibacteriales bacterium]
MLLARLKKIRIAVSILFFLFTAVLFLDFKSYIPITAHKYILYVQFVPSLLKFVNVLSIAAAGFIFIIILTLLFGRVYCSTICPLGTLQDIAIYITRKFRKKKKNRFRYLRPQNLLRYGLLTLAVIPVLFGSMFVLDLLDPYSNFGKINSNLLRPVLVFLNNSAAYTLESFKNYSLYPFELRTISLLGAGFSVLFLAFVLWMSISKGRLYCNTVCPVGTLLGLISRFSIFKIAIDETKCKGCGICERTCKSGCIDNKTRSVDFSRCVSCFNCFNVCPSEGLTYEKPSKEKETVDLKETDTKKREFIFKTSAYLVGLSGLAFMQQKKVIKSYKKNSVPTFKQNPLTPPGSRGIDHFTSTCTACHLCVSACPAQVLQPAYLEYGLRGMMQPHMDYMTSFCQYECTICTDVCPNGAILPLTLETKKLTQLGKVKFVKDDCIVKTENTDCGACSEHCPTKAVNMVPYKGKLSIPEVKDEYCIGCGACEYACPARPYKAIYVEGNPKHLIAKKPEVKKIDQKVDYKEDFPF